MTARRPLTLTIALALALALAVVLTACADDPATSGGDPSPVPPAGGDDVVLRLSYEGGFVPVDYHVLAAPAFTLYGDGTVITPGAQIEIYPGPALPAIVQRRVDPQAIDAIVERAREAGLGRRDLDLADTGNVAIADASTAVFTLTIDGRTTTARVYALGLEGDPVAQPGLSEEEAELRRDLSALAQDLGDLSWVEEAGGTLGTESMYLGQAARLIVGRLREDPELVQEPVDWPLDAALATLGEPIEVMPHSRCAVVDGPDWHTLVGVAQGANQLTPWTDGDQTRSIAFRPLLPDESGC